MAQVILSLAIGGSRKADGSPNAAGKVWPTKANSADVAQVFKDWQKLSVHPNPIILDEAGKAEIWVDSAVDLRVETSDGSLLHDITAATQTNAGAVEVVNAGFTGKNPNDGTLAAGQRTTLDAVLTSLAASLGGIDGKFLASPSAVGLKLRDWMSGVHVNVKSFGAIGNGIADDTVAIQATINFVQGLGGGIVHFPPGNFLTSATLTIQKTGVTLEGSGSGASVIKYLPVTGDAFTVTVAALGKGEVDIIFSNLIISTATATSGTSINATAGGVMLDRCGIPAGFRNGITFAGNDASINVINASVLFSSDNAGSAIKFSGNNDGLFISNTLIGGLGSTTAGITVSGTLSTVQVSSSELSAVATAASIGANVADFRLSSTVITSGVITDARVSSPLNYSLGVNTSVTLAPLQNETTRIVATAAITVTLAAIGATGWGRPFRLICSNASGGAVVWAFNAQFVLNAAVAPATGNRINLSLEYNPADNKVYENARAATAN